MCDFGVCVNLTSYLNIARLYATTYTMHAGGETLPPPDLDDEKKEYFEFLDAPRGPESRSASI